LRWLAAAVLLVPAVAGGYLVRPGDTLFSLARRFNTTVEAIRRANGLEGDLILVGQSLVIPPPDLEALVTPYLGARYRLGATGPREFDCSGLVVRVYRELGVELPRTSAAQFEALEPVDEPRPGDLVFFGFRGTGVDHVGIYLGEGRFVHASVKGVVIEDLGLPWYRRAYRGARRVPLGYDSGNERAQDHTPGATPR